MRAIHLHSPERNTKCEQSLCAFGAVVRLHVIDQGLGPQGTVRLCRAHFLEFAADVETWEFVPLPGQVVEMVMPGPAG